MQQCPWMNHNFLLQILKIFHSNFLFKLYVHIHHCKPLIAFKDSLFLLTLYYGNPIISTATCNNSEKLPRMKACHWLTIVSRVQWQTRSITHLVLLLLSAKLSSLLTRNDKKTTKLKTADWDGTWWQVLPAVEWFSQESWRGIQSAEGGGGVVWCDSCLWWSWRGPGSQTYSLSLFTILQVDSPLLNCSTFK